jgi:hypothetical protein
MANRKDENVRDGTSGDSSNSGRGTEREIDQAAETATGHPISAAEGGARGDVLSGDMPPHDTNPERMQHSRKGQAQSPRELTHNEQPKQKEGHK